MLVINKTSGTVHHKKVRAEKTIQEKRGGSFFGIRHDIDIWVKWNMTCDPTKQVWHLTIINGANAS